MEDCEFTLNTDDFMTLMMGAGVGYFLIGYLISSCCCYYRNLNIDNEEVLVAREVV